MSEPINVEARVDELTQPGKEAELSSILNEQFNGATNSATSNPAEGDKTPEPKAADPVTDPEPAKPGEGEPSKTGEPKAGEEADKGKDTFKDLLADRTKAEDAAANAQTEVQILTKQVSDLTGLVQKLTSGKAGEGEGDPNGDPSADDKLPTTKEELAKVVDDILNKKAENSNATEAAEKSITDAIQALDNIPEFKGAIDFKDQIAEAMRNFPTMKAKAAYFMLVGAGVIPTEIISSNANRTGTGNRSKTSLIKTKSAEDMTQAEREQLLFAAQKSGDLNI